MPEEGLNRSMSEQPIISIIVAVFNESANIPGLLQSMTAQNYEATELIIVDGGSVDGSVEILQSCEADIDRWISEKDAGIYDAWNKGLDLATGDFVCFIGADDRWAQHDSLEKLAAATGPDTDLVCANCLVDFRGANGNKTIGRPWEWENLRRGMDLCHRGMLHSKLLFRDRGNFNTRFKIAGDYEFLLRCGKWLNAAYLDEVMIIAGCDGISFRKPLLSFAERYLAQKKHRTVKFPRPEWYLIRDYARYRYRKMAAALKRRFGRDPNNGQGG